MAWPVPRGSDWWTKVTPVEATACADEVFFIADDGVDIGGRGDLRSGGDDVEQEGLAADLVEGLGALRLEARAFARGHDGDGEVWFGHVDYSTGR